MIARGGWVFGALIGLTLGLLGACAGTVRGLDDSGVEADGRADRGVGDQRAPRADTSGTDTPGTDTLGDTSADTIGDAPPAQLDLGPSPDAGSPPPPTPLVPCASGTCWTAPALGNACGSSTISEDFSSGKYNVHRYPLTAPKGITLDVTAKVTGGSWSPALIVHDGSGATLYDGEKGLLNGAIALLSTGSGRGKSSASFRVTAQANTALSVFVSGWSVVDGGFTPFLSKSAKYDVTVVANCKPPPPGALKSPPNFDPSNKDAKGYYLLPPSSPSGLYTRKADACSRGTRLLIDVLYTVASRWRIKRPALSPITIRDLNEGPCSSVNHATHDDGTHADLLAGCATQVACTDNQPAIDLAKLFVDTGEVCGILNNDVAVQAVVNAYFKSKYSYKPWKGTFMRSVSGHTKHFHVRVKKPNGTCN